MIAVKSPREIELMRIAGRIAGETLRKVGAMVEPGITTAELNRETRKAIEACDATPSFLGYNDFPASL